MIDLVFQKMIIQLLDFFRFNNKDRGKGWGL